MSDETIDQFDGMSFKYLSNFSLDPVKYEGIFYKTSENAFQAAKTLDYNERRKFKDVDPGTAKKMGRKVELRKDWESVKDQVMLEILRIKFSESELKTKLLSTGNRKLVEGNIWHDCTWGVCRCARCGNKGENRLGILLMQVRSELATVDSISSS